MAVTQNLSFGSVTLTVTPEVLHSKAEEVSGRITAMTNEFNDMNTNVKKSLSYWIGEAGDLHRKIYLEKQPDIETIFNRLQEHVNELHQMAQVYTDVEKTIKAEVETLLSDVII